MEISDNAVHSGKIIFFRAEAGWGFLGDDSGDDYFYHISGVKNGYIPSMDDKVTFVPAAGRDGRPCAVQIKPIK